MHVLHDALLLRSGVRRSPDLIKNPPCKVIFVFHFNFDCIRGKTWPNVALIWIFNQFCESFRLSDLAWPPREHDRILLDVVPDVLDGGERRPKVLVGMGHALRE